MVRKMLRITYGLRGSIGMLCYRKKYHHLGYLSWGVSQIFNILMSILSQTNLFLKYLMLI